MRNIILLTIALIGFGCSVLSVVWIGIENYKKCNSKKPTLTAPTDYRAMEITNNKPKITEVVLKDISGNIQIKIATNDNKKGDRTLLMYNGDTISLNVHNGQKWVEIYP